MQAEPNQRQNVSTAVNYYEFVRPQQLRFFHRLHDRKSIKKASSPVFLNKVELTLNDFYDIFMQFLQLLYLTASQKEALWIAKALIKRETEKFFYYSLTDEEQKGFKKVRKDTLWPQSVRMFWDDLKEVKPTNLISKDRSEQYVQFCEWMSSEKWLSESSLNEEKTAKNQLLDLLHRLQLLKISEFRSISKRIKEISLLSRIDLRTKGKEIFGDEGKDAIYQVRLFNGRIQKLISELSDHQNLISRNSCQTDSQGQFFISLKSDKPFCLRRQIYIKIHPSSTISYSSSYKDLDFIKQCQTWIRVTLKIEQTSPNNFYLTITTHPYWKVLTQDLLLIREVYQELKIQLQKQTQYLANDPKVIDFKQVTFRSIYEKSEERMQLTQNQKINLKTSVNLQIIGCLEKQLMFWTVVQKMLEYKWEDLFLQNPIQAAVDRKYLIALLKTVLNVAAQKYKLFRAANQK